MIAGAIFFTRSVPQSSGGAQTPVAAVRRLFDALEEEDVIGILETLLPSERRMLAEPIQDVAEELGRLEILNGGLDLSNLNGLDFEFYDLGFASTELTPDLSVVEVSKGRARYRFAPVGGLVGNFLRDALPDEALGVSQGSTDLSDGESVFAVVRDGGDWYVSIWYSVAENSRRDAQRALPVFGAGVPARGAATPEAAVDQLIRAAASFDVRRLIELTPPEEARALHDYAQIFIHEAEAGAAQARKDFRGKVTALELSSRIDGDRAVVKVDDIAFRYQIPELDASVTYDGECVVFHLAGEPPERDCGAGVGPALPFFLPPVDVPQADIGFAVVREGGAWYVSPTGTLLEGMVGILKAMTMSDLEAIKDFLQFGFTDEFSFPEVVPEGTPNA
ncbi:MAG: hypothetical protein ACRDKS_06825, partial [Actinomycetota bacterium]